MEIRPHFGTGTIKFGLTEKEIIEQLGEPSNREVSIFEDEDPGNSQLLLEYENLGLGFTFSSDTDFRLDSIDFTNSQHTLFGDSYVGQEESLLYQESVKSKLVDLKLDDDFVELGSKDFYSALHGVSFWVQDNTITHITIFPEYDEEGNNEIWPD